MEIYKELQQCAKNILSLVEERLIDILLVHKINKSFNILPKIDNLEMLYISVFNKELKLISTNEIKNIAGGIIDTKQRFNIFISNFIELYNICFDFVIQYNVEFDKKQPYIPYDKSNRPNNNQQEISNKLLLEAKNKDSYYIASKLFMIQTSILRNFRSFLREVNKTIIDLESIREVIKIVLKYQFYLYSKHRSYVIPFVNFSLYPTEGDVPFYRYIITYQSKSINDQTFRLNDIYPQFSVYYQHVDEALENNADFTDPIDNIILRRIIVE